MRFSIRALLLFTVAFSLFVVVNMIPENVGSGRVLLQRGWPLGHSIELSLPENGSFNLYYFGAVVDLLVAVGGSALFTWAGRSCSDRLFPEQGKAEDGS